jgi:hypothetical protein
MTSDEYCNKVKNMSIEQLLDEVMENPEYLTDGYYMYPLGKALFDRYKELKANNG